MAIELEKAKVMLMQALDTPEGMIAIVAVFIVLLLALRLVMKPRQKVSIDAEEWRMFPLIDKKSLSHDVRRFRFGLPSSEHIVGLPVGQHISFKYNDADGKLVMRSYTPVSSDEEKGYVDFVIKVYAKDVHPNFPQGGKMSQYLDSLKIGDSMSLRGPKGTVHYQGKGKFSLRKGRETSTRQVKKVGLIAGGTGITPCLQVVRAALRDPLDKTEFSLLFANQTEEDIFLREELEDLTKDKRFKLWYTVDRPPARGWKYDKGFISADMVRAHMPPPCPNGSTLLFVCGPQIMVDKACAPAFEKLGYSATEWHQF